MSATTIIAIDAMGGDHAPDCVLGGVDIGRRRHPDLRFQLYGDEAILAPAIGKLGGLREVVTVHHTTEFVGGDDKPSQAVRRRGTSLRLAIEAVKQNQAQGIVSAGNTGALMGLSMLSLGTLSGIDRPAIAGFLPTVKGGEAVILDLGANVSCDAQNLVQFAVMGEVFARTLQGVNEPTIGLLNIGSESAKGNDIVRQAAAILSDVKLPMRFFGFVEGNDILSGKVDVIVTDGFTGNVALKTVEGTAQLITGFLNEAFHSSVMASIGYLFARRALKKMRIRADPRRYNGAMLLGLNGVVVKSHGGTDALGFATAIDTAYDMIKYGFNSRIADELAHLPVPGQGVAAEAALGNARAGGLRRGPRAASR